MGYNRVAYPYGLPPNYTPLVMRDDASHVPSPILEGEPPRQSDEVHEDRREHAQGDIDSYSPVPVEGLAPNTLPQPNLTGEPQNLPAQPIFISFFHGLFLNGWRLLSPLFLCLPLHLHGGKSPLKDPIEAQRFRLHRSPTSKLPSSGNQSTRASSSEEIYLQEDGQSLMVKEKCKEVSVSSKRTPLKLKDSASIEAPKASFHHNARRIGATGAKRKEGDTHAVTSTPTRIKLSQICHGIHQYVQHQPSFSAHAGDSSNSAPVQTRAPAPIQREALQATAPTPTRPAGNAHFGTGSNAIRNFPPRPTPEFTPIPMTYKDLLPSLVANQMAVISPGRIYQPPFPKWYNPNATFAYHGKTPGHSIEQCLAFKHKVQSLIEAGWLTFQEDRPNVKTNPLANHGGGAVNAIESGRPCRSKPLKDVTTPRRFIYEALQKGGVIPRGGHKKDSCLMHPGAQHNMQSMFGSRRPTATDDRPRDTAPQMPRYPSVVRPIPFPYKNNHADTWRYAPPSERKEEAAGISSLSAKVTNITGLSGMTRSGRMFAPPDLPTQPANAKGKAKIAEEQNDIVIPAPNEDVPMKGLSEKRDGCGEREVSLEETGEFLRIIQQSEFKVIEQLNKTPARVSLLELLMSYEPHRTSLNNGGRTSLVCTRGNHGKFGLGYKPMKADIRKNIAKRKNRGQGSWLGQQAEGAPPCHISRTFISAGLRHEGQVAAICEDDPSRGSDLVRPCPPGFQLGNWRVEERTDVYATSIISNDESLEGTNTQDSAVDFEQEAGSSAASEFDSHRFRSAEHQQCFEGIRGWSFHKERHVQLREDEYTDFHEEIARRRWTPLVTPIAKFDPEIALEFYANAWPTEEGVQDMRSWVRGQWIPFDADALSQFLGDPLVLEESQQWRRVRIMHTSMTTLTQTWMTLLLSNVMPSDHNSDLPLPKFQLVYAILTRMSVHVAQVIANVIYLFAGMVPTRHPLDPDKSYRALGFLALITGLC
ncbi:hypothetical protein HKD37_13G036578 [Glycine soja]